MAQSQRLAQAGVLKQIGSQAMPIRCGQLNRVTAESCLRKWFSQSCTRQEDEAAKTRVRARKTPTTHRRKMYAWLNESGRNFREPIPGQTNYLGMYREMGRISRKPLHGFKRRGNGGEDESADNSVDSKPADDKEEYYRPYPLNPDFFSQAVLSEPLKDEIYKRAVEYGEPISTISISLDVDVRRVAAVVRMKTIELKWEEEGKPLATQYARAVMGMLPQTEYIEGASTAHEHVTDLPVHPDTRQQIFYPTSESRQFTRTDAAKVFSSTLLPADKRIPHAQLLDKKELWTASDESTNEEYDDMEEDDEDEDDVDDVDVSERAQTTSDRSGDDVVEDDGESKELEDAITSLEFNEQDIAKLHAEMEGTVMSKQSPVDTVPARRWDFKFEHVEADVVGNNPRDARGVGWRYGMPHEDRKRGQKKGIPLSVDV